MWAEICAECESKGFQLRAASTIRPVPIKTLAQQDIQTFLNVRQLISMGLTQLINHVRGLLAKYGIVLNKGKGSTELRRALYRKKKK